MTRCQAEEGAVTALSKAEIEKALRLISKAWGKQSGYAFFPWISGKARNREERIKSYHEGPAYLWPRDREKIINFLVEQAAAGNDVYWCPSLFEKQRRQMEYAMDEHALWADLDECDPREIDQDLRPSIAWETSPGRYQALWLITQGDMQGASWHGGENQRLTYYLNADLSGWDTVQLLRLPGWPNYKLDHRERLGLEVGEGAPAKLLWQDGPRYLPTDFEDLPEINGATQGIENILEDEIEAIDTKAVWGRVRLRVSKAVRELMAARDASGADRSAKLWEIERELADAGCTTTEIVAVVRDSVWNKFHGRQDELKRLIVEAGKAIAARPAAVEKAIEEEREDKPGLTNFFELLKTVKAPQWMVKEIWTEGGVGFIAGQPKSYKSFIALDLMFSVASGMPFLNYFRIVHPGPVLYLQEEDSAPILQARKNAIWPTKLADRLIVSDGSEGMGNAGDLLWLPPSDTDELQTPIQAAVGVGFTISDDGWQAWLDEHLDKGYTNGSGPNGSRLGNSSAEPYRLLVLDPLMMMAGDVDEIRAQDMTRKIFRPLKELARKHQVAVCLVHHMRKAGNEGYGREARGGQLLLGSVANHAWSEDSLYIRTTKRGKLYVEQESKSGSGLEFIISNVKTARSWDPHVKVIAGAEGEATVKEELAPESKPASGNGTTNGKAKRGRPLSGKALGYLTECGMASAGEISARTGLALTSVYDQLKRAEKAGLVMKKGAFWVLGQ